MKKFSKKIVACGICAALCIAGASTAFSLTGNKIEEATNEETEAVEVISKNEASAGETSKDETVYVFAGSNGSVQKIVVSDCIKNALGESSINDASDLKDIENVKGDETYKDNGDVKVWDADGNDIYYQGNIEKELPVEMNISYKLDGKEISAEDIAGKSGHVTIRFDYKNNQYETVNVNGKSERIYVPFAMLTGMILDNDTFRNIEVTNGKLIDDGDRTVIAGIALPGVQENLGIGKDKIEIPDYLEITADATDFNFGMTVTIATNELFNKLDTSNLNSIDGMKDSIGQLTDGMNQLLDGSAALYGGLNTLVEAAAEPLDGIGQLVAGAKELSDGAAVLDDGASQLQAGANELAVGLNTLKSNNATLNGGARQVFESLLSMSEQQIKAAGLDIPALSIGNYAAVLNNVISSLDSTAVYNQALAQVTAAVEANRPLIISAVTEAVRNQVEVQVTAVVRNQVAASVDNVVRMQVTEQVIAGATGMSKADYDMAVAAGMIPQETQAAINAAIEEKMQSSDVNALKEANVEAQMGTPEIASTISANTDAQMATDAIKATINNNVEIQVEQAISENMASPEVQAKLTAASEGAQTIIGLKASLDSYNAFYLGLLTYTDGVATAADGATILAAGIENLKDGTTQFRAGSAALFDGMLQLKNGIPLLTDGVSQLKDGAQQLNEGLVKFNEEGIEKIVSLLEGDLENVIARLKATSNVSKNYRNFSGIADGMDGKVKFIYRTEEIK